MIKSTAVPVAATAFVGFPLTTVPRHRLAARRTGQPLRVEGMDFFDDDLVAAGCLEVTSTPPRQRTSPIPAHLTAG